MMYTMRARIRLLLMTAAAATWVLAGWAATSRAVEPDSREGGSPWGIASGAEWANDYPKFNPLLRDAGVRSLRYFPEWQTLQPKQGQWDWRASDAFVANCRENSIEVTGSLAYFARWASADGGTRKGPIKEMQFWRDYVHGLVGRYQQDITHWEVWNEFNGSFYEGRDKVKDYADLVVSAYDAAKAVNPNIKIGLSVANFDVSFLEATINAGAAGHFDYIAVHPYENAGAIADGGEVGYLSLVASLRDMLRATGQRADIPLWITEVGYQVSVEPELASDALNADMLIKTYLLSLVQGFERIFWFEARGPSYGKNTDHGIIRPDWTLRPSYHAFGAMTRTLGPRPRYIGWLNLGQGGYGFMFAGDTGPVLAAWAPPSREAKTTFPGSVRVTSSVGAQSVLAANVELALTSSPVYVTDLPAELVNQAKDNVGKPYPWGGDYANATVVTCKLGVTNMEDGLKQVKPQTTVAVNMLDHSVRRTNFAHGNEGRYCYFRVDPQFVPYGTEELEITVVVKRAATDKPAAMTITYESKTGYTSVPKGHWTIPEADGWHEHTWKVDNANFVGQWGWNFRLDASGSPNEYLIKEARVRRARSGQ